MSKIIFSPAAVFRLQQTANRIYKQTGIRHKLSDTDGILNVLAEGKMSREIDIKQCYQSFLLALDDIQFDNLAKSGIPLRSSHSRTNEKFHQSQR